MRLSQMQKFTVPPLPDILNLVPVNPYDFALPSKLDSEGSVFVGVVGVDRIVEWKAGKFSGATGETDPASSPDANIDKQIGASSPVLPTEVETQRPSRWVKYQDADAGHLLREVVKYTGWGRHEAEVFELESIFRERFPSQVKEFYDAKKEGEEQFSLWDQLDASLRDFGPESMEALTTCQLLTDRWPFLGGKVRRKVEAARQRQEVALRGALARTSSVVAWGDHRLGAVQPAATYIVLIDESGKNFGGTSGPEGKFVAVIAPEGVLGEFKIHAAEATPEECDRVMQDLLDKNTAVLGVRLSDLPPLDGDRWYDGVLELLFWISRVTPLPSDSRPVKFEVFIEQRGRAEAGDRWPEAARAIIRSLLAVDVERAGRLNININVASKGHPFLSYADVVAHAWSAGSPNAASRLRSSGLCGTCLPNGDTRIVRDAWDSFGASKILSELHWRGLLGHPDSEQEFSLAGSLLHRAGESAAQNLSIWAAYLSSTKQHLESKRIDLHRLSREVSWLEKWMPSATRLPLDIEFMWTTAQLAEGNHYGDVASQMVGELTEQGNRLLEERAPLVCWADLHRAVAHTNRFEFELATKALARWKTEPPRVAGLQLWGRVQSSFGQHAAFQERHAEAREHFQLALMAFDELSDQTSAALDRMQTGTYFAINEMDEPEADPLRIRAAVERVTGSLTDAVPRLARSASRADQYVHHLLLRWMVTMQARFPQTLMPEVAHYLAEEAHWGREHGHPWPLICCYRALLLPEPKKAASLLREAVNLSWSEDQKGTVRLIGAVIAAIAESGGMAFPNLETELFEIEEAIPAARARLVLLEDWRETPTSPLELLRGVLPFNFH